MTQMLSADVCRVVRPYKLQSLPQNRKSTLSGAFCQSRSCWAIHTLITKLWGSILASPA